MKTKRKQRRGLEINIYDVHGVNCLYGLNTTDRKIGFDLRGTPFEVQNLHKIMDSVVEGCTIHLSKTNYNKTNERRK